MNRVTFVWESKTIGVISPFGVATATDISTTLYCLIVSPIHAEFASGTFKQAKDAALIMKSLTLIGFHLCSLAGQSDRKALI